MPKLYLIRHGQAAASWGEDLDPGLSDAGRAQAEAAAETLLPLAPIDVISSPLRRCRETAAAFASRAGLEPRIVKAVAEIPSPDLDVAERSAWLREVMAGNWSVLDDGLKGWRQGVIDALNALEKDTLIFSHFIAINVAVGDALGDDRMVVFRPDNASITIMETDGGRLRLIEKGREAQTEVR